MAKTQTVRVRGVTYRNPDEAYVAAEELEHHADQLAEQLRRSGKEGEADTVQDRGHADAERLRTWARDREAAEADATEQPADRPRETRRSHGGGRRRASRPRAGPRSRSRRGGVFTPRTQRIVEQTRIPAAASSATTLLLQALGMSLGVAFLVLLLSRRGVQAFADLAGGTGRGLSWLIEPVDPLAPRPKPAAAGVQGASLQAATYARSGAATRRPVATGVIR